MHEIAFDGRGSRVRWAETPGQSPARVYVHGLGGTGFATFGHIAGHPLLGGHWSLVIDLPGHGHSDRPADWAYTLDGFADVIGKIMDSAGTAETDLVGHSMGGSIAIVLAARRPDRVRRLVVAEANLDPLPPSPAGLGSQQIAAQAETAFVDSGYARLMAAEPGWAPTLRLCDPRAVHRSAVGLVTGSRPTMRELLMGLPMPRTFIRGDRGERLERPDTLLASGTRIVTIPDAGHRMMLDAPEAFVRALAEALDAAAPGVQAAAD